MPEQKGVKLCHGKMGRFMPEQKGAILSHCKKDDSYARAKGHQTLLLKNG